MQLRLHGVSLRQHCEVQQPAIADSETCQPDTQLLVQPLALLDVISGLAKPLSHGFNS